jgi:hypothetical protein
MRIGVDSFEAVISGAASGITLSAVQRAQNLLEEIKRGDEVARCARRS